MWIIRKLLTLITLVLLLTGSVVAFYYYQFLFKPLPVEPNGHVFNIEPGASTQKIAESLQKEGLIKHPVFFIMLLKWEGVFGKLKAGEYLVLPGTTPKTLIDLLVSGKVIQHSLTIIPGWTFNQLIQTVHEAPKLKHTLIGLTNEQIMTQIGHQTEHPEGRFLPETYYFPAGTTDVAFLKRAYQLLEDKLQAAWLLRDPNLSLKTAYEALILASIIEKESDLTEEYHDIAGVYIRRLEKNMLLQADPTVIYGLGKDFVGPLTLSALQIPSPYNTYLNVGLPPTPISIVSLKAIEAALHPKPGETLYFVAKGEGKKTGHTFSKTGEEHRAAVLEYRKTQIQEKK